LYTQKANRHKPGNRQKSNIGVFRNGRLFSNYTEPMFEALVSHQPGLSIIKMRQAIVIGRCHSRVAAFALAVVAPPRNASKFWVIMQSI